MNGRADLLNSVGAEQKKVYYCFCDLFTRLAKYASLFADSKSSFLRRKRMKAKGLASLINLMEALILVESGGNDRAIGDRHLKEKAYGPLQIRQPVCDDYNRAHGTKYKAEVMLGNRPLSKKVCQWYLEHYTSVKVLGRKPTLENLARIWNGGPSGWKKRSTEKYWVKVNEYLRKE